MKKAPVSIPIQEIIGDTSHLKVEVKDFLIRGLTVRTWIYRNEQLTSQKPPVIGIHGGPAFTHRYILPLKLLADHGHPVILYDQAGCGESSHVTDVVHQAPWLLTVEYYLEELEQIISGYNLMEYYLYGSSWGTIVAQEWAVRQPRGLYGILLDGALSDPQLYINTQRRDRIGTLPTYTQQLLQKVVDTKDFSNPIYEELNNTLGKMFTCRQIPPPDVYYESNDGCDLTIYSLMQGDCEFMIGGVLETWNINDRLHKIQIPTIVIVGEYDTMSVECSNAIVDRVPTAWPLVVIPRAAHCKLLDEPQLCIEVMRKFLHTVEMTRSLRPNQV